jgi:hypothetical protein
MGSNGDGRERLARSAAAIIDSDTRIDHARSGSRLRRAWRSASATASKLAIHCRTWDASMEVEESALGAIIT